MHGSHMATSKFRPCIDLHGGKVKQIVGGSLCDTGLGLQENFVSERSAGEFADMFRQDALSGGHVIKLGAGNEQAAQEALSTWPGGLQIGGGIRRENASEWLTAGASHVIVTSSIFSKEGIFLPEELTALSAEVGKEQLILDLSCKRVGDKWMVAMNRWQTVTDLELSPATLSALSTYCSEFLIHAADVEGLSAGMDTELVQWLGAWAKDTVTCPVTYAGGIYSTAEIDQIQTSSQGHVHYTVGSALDIFGGDKLRYSDLVERNTKREHA